MFEKIFGVVFLLTFSCKSDYFVSVGFVFFVKFVSSVRVGFSGYIFVNFVSFVH